MTCKTGQLWVIESVCGYRNLGDVGESYPWRGSPMREGRKIAVWLGRAVNHGRGTREGLVGAAKTYGARRRSLLL